SGVPARTAADGIAVEVTVRNTGERAGREVVQVYVSVPGSRVTRAPRELKGFADVELEPGASQRVRIDIPAAELQHWSTRAGAWVVEAGTYRVEVGASSRDLRGSAEVELAGDEPVLEATLSSTPLEIAEIPGRAEKLEQLMEGTPFFTDAELREMREQISGGAFTCHTDHARVYI